MSHPNNLIVSIDDADNGNIALAQQILDIGITPLFYIQTMGEDAQYQIETLSKMGCDIGSHTMSHPGDIKLLPLEEARAEIEISKRQIEDWTGKECKHFAYPRGRHNDQTVELVKAAGYETARTTHVLRTTWEDQFRMPTAIHVCTVRKEYQGRPWEAMAQFYWEHCKKTGETFHIWGHVAEMKLQGQTESFINFLKTITV